MRAMNTRSRIVSLLSQNKKPLRVKGIALKLKKSDANIRKILSNLYKEGKIGKTGYGEYVLSVNVKNRSVNVLGKSVNVKSESVNVEDLKAKKLINKEIWKYRKVCLQRLKINDPEAYELIKKARRRYLRNWRIKNPDYNKLWLRAYYRKYPEKFREYARRYWRKRAISLAVF